MTALRGMSLVLSLCRLMAAFFDVPLSDVQVIIEELLEHGLLEVTAPRKVTA
jgi:hypothetical protein